MNDEEARQNEFLFANITGFSKEKCAQVFSKYSVSEVLENPMLFEGTSAQVHKIEQVYELVRAVKVEKLLMQRRQIGGPSDAFDFFENTLGVLDHEEVHLLLLNTRHRIIRCVPVAKGGLAGAALFPRELVREALKHNAAAVMIAHNHPSGDPKPSPDDVSTTKQLSKAFALVGIDFVDHIVVGKGCSVSLKELGLMEQKCKYEPELDR